MKIHLSLPRPGFRLANGGWLDGGPPAVTNYHAGGAQAAVPVRPPPSEYAVRHRARCDIPVIDLPPQKSRSWRPTAFGPSTVIRRDQNVQTLDGGEALNPPSKKAAVAALSMGLLGEGGGGSGSLPNISQSRNAQQQLYIPTFCSFTTQCSCLREALFTVGTFLALTFLNLLSLKIYCYAE